MEPRECSHQRLSTHKKVQYSTQTYIPPSVQAYLTFLLGSLQELVSSRNDKVMQKTPHDLLDVDYRAMLAGIA
jgi:hypothetical protein